MALTVSIGEPTIERTRNLIRASLVVTISDGQTVVHEETIIHRVNPDNGSSRELLVEGLRAKALAVKAAAADEQALDVRLQALKSDIEAALTA